MRQMLELRRPKKEEEAEFLRAHRATIGSIKTIEHNGVLENVISGPGVDKPKRRYWIDTGRGAT
jgi:predicted acetyltransferase